jgi:hypothetical protein
VGGAAESGRLLRMWIPHISAKTKIQEGWGRALQGVDHVLCRGTCSTNFACMRTPSKTSSKHLKWGMEMPTGMAFQCHDNNDVNG